MPCRSDDFYPSTISGIGLSPPIARHVYDELKAEADLATRLLCAVTAKMTKKKIEAIPELAEWVAKHAEIDRQRRAAEKAELEKKLAQANANLERLKKERDELMQRALGLK